MGVTQVTVPDIGDFADVEIIEILVTPGDTVKTEDALLTLESDKATMDVPSPAAGAIQEVLVAVGDRVSEGTVIVTLEEDTAAAKTPPPAAAEPLPLDDDPESAPPPVASAPPVAHSPPPSLPPPVDRSGAVPVHASPGVRRFSRQLGADLTQVRGSGPKGRILKEDVQTHIKQRLSQPAQSAAGAGGNGIPAIPDIDFSKFGEIEKIELPRIKRISGPHLHRSWLNVPHVTHHDEADITELEAFRQSLKDEAAQAGTRITALVFIAKALAVAMKQFPHFNASLSADAQSLVLKKYFHVGIAVDTPNGLVVPVIRNVDSHGFMDLALAMGEISARARDGKLKAEDMQGGCITISSLGGIGGTAFTPIVNAPEVAILGVTRARMTPVWDGENFAPRLMLPLDLSYDHRVIDGAGAARFMVYLCQLLQDIRRLLL